MITKATAAKIWNAYQEIDNAKKLIVEIDEVNQKQAREQNPRDESGGRRGYEMGVPCSSGGHRIFQVRPDMGNLIIQEHIKDKEKELVELEVLARQELGLNPAAVDISQIELTVDEANHLGIWALGSLEDFKAWALKHPCSVIKDELEQSMCKKLGIWEQIQELIEKIKTTEF